MLRSRGSGFPNQILRDGRYGLQGFDQRKPLDPSGIRIGTAALTTRGMKQGEMQKVGAWILRVLRSADGAGAGETVRREIAEFARAFPVPGIG